MGIETLILISIFFYLCFWLISMQMMAALEVVVLLMEVEVEVAVGN